MNFAFSFLYYLEEVLAVLVLDHWLGEFTHTFFGDPTSAVGNSLEAGYLESLTLFDDFYEC